MASNEDRSKLRLKIEMEKKTLTLDITGEGLIVGAIFLALVSLLVGVVRYVL